jgi:hypothetical protein
LEFAEFVHQWLAGRKLDYDGMRKKYQQVQKLKDADYLAIRNALRNTLMKGKLEGRTYVLPLPVRLL